MVARILDLLFIRSRERGRWRGKGSRNELDGTCNRTAIGWPCRYPSRPRPRLGQSGAGPSVQPFPRSAVDARFVESRREAASPPTRARPPGRRQKKNRLLREPPFRSRSRGEGRLHVGGGIQPRVQETAYGTPQARWRQDHREKTNRERTRVKPRPPVSPEGADHRTRTITASRRRWSSTRTGAKESGRVTASRRRRGLASTLGRAGLLSSTGIAARRRTRKRLISRGIEGGERDTAGVGRPASPTPPGCWRLSRSWPGRGECGRTRVREQRAIKTGGVPGPRNSVGP